MSTPTCHRCAYCGSRIVTPGDPPPGWSVLGGAIACCRCIVLARVLAS